MRLFYSLFLGISVVQALALSRVIPSLEVPGQTAQLLWLQFGLFSLITLLTVVFGFRSMKAGSFSAFQGIFFGSILAKMILAGTIALLLKRSFPEGGYAFVLPIAIAYLPYLALEILGLLYFSRKFTSQDASVN